MLPPPLARIALLLLAVAALLSVAVRADAAVSVRADAAVPEASAPAATAPSADIPRGRGRWSWPVPAPHVMTRDYSPPADRYGSGHRGIDLAAARGAVVTAPADGTVSFAGRVVERPVLSIDVGDGVIASMEPVSTTLHAGDAVTAGQQVGVVAAGGHCDGTCVHLGARIDGEYVNPLLFLGLAPRAVLLPLGR